MASNSEVKAIEKQVHPILRVILQGVNDTGSPLSILQGVPEIIDRVWYLVTFYWKSHIKESSLSDLSHIQVNSDIVYNESEPEDCDYVAKFPKPKDLNINMMPFVISNSFDDAKLPEYLEDYWDPLITKCIRYILSGSGVKENGTIGYITIHESYVDADVSQRRPGIHIESPGVFSEKKLKGQDFKFSVPANWGGGFGHSVYLEGGIYMASNVDNSCEVWNCKVLRSESGPEVTGELGDIEHLRDFLPQSEIMKSNRIYWITDRTPHESLPLKKGTYRQFFRLVTSQVSIWYEDHSTKNPLGVVPDPNITKIVKGSKFDGKSLILSD